MRLMLISGRSARYIGIMITKHLLAVVLISLALLLPGCSKKGAKSPEDITTTVAWVEGRAALPVFPFGTNPIYMFVTDESRDCKKMDRNVFARPEIIKYMNRHFTSIWVEPAKFDTIQFLGQAYTRDQFKQAFKIETYPAHLFFSMRAELKGVRDGYIPQDEFKPLLKYIAEGYIEKYDFGTFLKMPESRVDTAWGEF